jgi:hypothetical protein
MAISYDDAVMLARLRQRGHVIPQQRGALSPDVARIVSEAHAQQRSAAAPAEPPKPWSLALRREQAHGQSQTVVTRDGVPQTYSTAIAQKRKQEGQ